MIRINSEGVPVQPPITIEEVTDPEENAKSAKAFEQAERNMNWLQGHWPDLLPGVLGKFLAVAGQEAVLSALGVRSPLGEELITPSLHALVPAMQEHGVRRLIWLSALGVGQTREQAPAMLWLPFSTVLRRIGRDKAGGEEYLRSTDLDWTLVYPPALTNGPRTGSYRSGETVNVRGLPRISRADVAEFMLGQLDDVAHIRRNAIVSR